MIKELGRLAVSLALLCLASFLFYFGFKMPEPAQALGAGSMAGVIIGSVSTYWLKP